MDFHTLVRDAIRTQKQWPNATVESTERITPNEDGISAFIVRGTVEGNSSFAYFAIAELFYDSCEIAYARAMFIRED